MAITKVTSGLISADASSIDLNIDAGTLYLDVSENKVGIGTSSPNTRLTVGSGSGTEVLTILAGTSGESQLRFADGTSGSAAYQGRVEYDHANSLLNLGAGGGTQVTINSSGNVGIGTTSPAQKLDVQGTAMMERSRLSTNDGTTYWDLRRDSSTGHFVISDDGLGDVVTIKQDSGNVGIGTTSPSTLLHLSNASNPAIRVTDTTNSLNIEITATDTIGYFGTESNHATAFITNNTERMRIDSSGNVGIGTSSPSFKLDVVGTVGLNTSGTGVLTTFGANNTTDKYLRIRNSNGNFELGTNNNLHYVYGLGSTPMGFFTNAAERMRINSAGQLGVGTSTFDAYAHHVIQSDNTQKVLDIKQNNASGRVLGLQYIPVGPDDTTDYYMVCSDSNTNDLFIYSNGNVANKNNSYGSSSDIKIKQNISDANSQWNDIKALQFKNYKLKTDVAKYGEDNANTLLGLIAQDVETAGMNGLVYESKDEDSDGNDLGTVTKGVKYSVLYLKAVKALQEAIVKIEDLESRIETLEG